MKDFVVGPAAKEEKDEEREGDGGDGAVKPRKVRAGDAAVVTQNGAGPKREDEELLPVDEVAEVDEDEGEKEQAEVEGAPGGEGESVGEEEGEILAPAFDHVGEANVHAGTEGVGGETEADVVFGALDVPGEIDVFEDGAADGSVAADGEVGRAVDEEELAVGSGDALGGVVDLGGGINAGELGEDERHEGALGEAGYDLTGRVGEQFDGVAVGFVEGADEVAGLVEGVGVGEEEPATVGLLGAVPAGVGFAGETAEIGAEVEGRGVEDVEARVLGGES
jgi:hypothetical protein